MTVVSLFEVSRVIRSSFRRMARLCERPGCSQPADVIYGIDAEHLVVWIESLDGAIAYRAGVLCRRHADAMVVPLGWMLDDRREAVPRLFKTREATPAPRPRGRRHRSHASRDETGQLELDASAIPADDDEAAPATAAQAALVVDADPAEETESAPADSSTAAAAALPWKPKFDQSDDLGGLLVARSPLLSRAFGKRDEPPA